MEEAKKLHKLTDLTSLGGLARYGDSDTDDDESADKPSEEPRDGAYSNANEDAVMEARRARAKEWSARRRAERSESQSEQV